MKILYLRTVFWFGLKSGGSVGHTSGVINALSNFVEVDVISNDILPGVHAEIHILPLGIFKKLPIRLGELLYSVKLIKVIRKKVKNYDYIYQRFCGLTFGGAFISRKYNIPLILEFNSSDVWKIKNWSKDPSFLKSILIRIANLITYIPQVQN